MFEAVAKSSIAARGNKVDFNYEFLIFLLVSSFLAIFFLLYFNRLFAFFVSYGVRTYTWRKYGIYLDIGAIQVSLLAGRIFFTGLKYHGANETFLVQHGYITWRYWLRRVREVDIVASTAQDADSANPIKNTSLPCRVHVNLNGLEWFVYNRSPAYDTVLAGLAESESAEPTSGPTSDEKHGVDAQLARGVPLIPDTIPPNKLQSSSSDASTHDKERATLGSPGLQHSNTSASLPGSSQRNTTLADLPFMVQLFPVQVECQKAAAVIGNENTKAILIVKGASVSTTIDASKTETPDPYRFTFKVQIEKPIVEMRENEDFQEDQASKAAKQHHGVPVSTSVPRTTFLRRQRRKLVGTLRSLIPSWQRSVESFSSSLRAGPQTFQIPGTNQWHGLTRYLDDRDQDDKTRWSSVEYGAISTILDSPSACLTVYWDNVAKVSEQARQHHHTDQLAAVNGDVPPAWGMHIVIHGGTVNYGPWADRQRADLQRVFFPSLSKDVASVQPLPVGAWRVPTKFHLALELDDAVTLRVPTRESSKNWRWRGQEPPLDTTETKHRKRRGKGKKERKTDTTHPRSYGWLEFKVPADSTVSYVMDMLACDSGFTNQLEVDLPSTELWSSVNHDVLWQSQELKLTCNLSNPLTWNTLRNWYFDISGRGLSLYLLRDHIFLLIDLVDDWTSGPPPDYLVFTPFNYRLNIDFQHLKLYLNVNDENIIDSATALEDNAYLMLDCPSLVANATIPIETFRPAKNTIPFDVHATSMSLTLQSPQSSTQAAFLTSNQLGFLDTLKLKGGYHYNATTSPANTDTLTLDVHGQSPYAYLYGYIIRYFIVLKDNYFGDHVHFRTLDEYQEQLALEQRPGSEQPTRPPPTKSNDLDVILAIKVDNPRIFLPTNLYSAEQYVLGELADLSIDLRFTNYYMEMELVLSPLNLALGSGEVIPDSPSESVSNTQLFIDGLRVFGHRLFGLPPSEPTYLCNWDVAVGRIGGECTASFVSALAQAGAAFGFTFDDVENALVPYSSLIFHDITFARVSVSSVHLWVHLEEAAFLLSCGQIDVKSNDWARSHYSKRAIVHIPNVQVSCLRLDNASRVRDRSSHPAETDAHLRADIHVAIIGRKYHFTEERELQQQLVRREDQRTHRTSFLVFDEFLDEFVPEPVPPPASAAPQPPEPVESLEYTDSSTLSGSSIRTGRIKRQQSFLSGHSSTARNARRRRRQSPDGQSTPIETDLLHPGEAETAHAAANRFASSTSSFGSSMGGGYLSRLASEEHHSSVAFSSQYFAPHFRLEQHAPLHHDTHSNEEDAERETTQNDDEHGPDLDLDDIDPTYLSEEHAYASFLLEFPTGIDVSIRTEAVQHVTSLLSSLQPREPENILDSIQIGAMDQIFAKQKQARVHGEVTDVMVRLPKANVRLLNPTATTGIDAPPSTGQDQYDVSLTRMALVTRTSADWDHATDDQEETNKSRTSLHLRLGSAILAASERSAAESDAQAAIRVQVDEVRVSLGAKDVTYLDADIGSIHGSTASSKIEYLASLIHRTGVLASDMGRRFAHPTASQKTRVKYLAYQLLTLGEAVNDPIFLIRPSALLRSADSHLRTRDSWKLITRLRQIWTSLSTATKARLVHECHGDSFVVPSDVGDKALAAFLQWRSWDLDNPAKSVFMRTVFGSGTARRDALEAQYPLLGACRLAELQLVLDPGPKQNRLFLKDLNARLQEKIIATPGQLPEMPGFKGSLFVLNACCGNADIVLNWQLYELAQDMLQLQQVKQMQTQRAESTGGPTAAGESSSRTLALQCVAEIIEGTVMVESINLKANSRSDGLRLSYLQCQGGERGLYQTALINCGQVESKIHSRHHLLGGNKLENASVFLSQHSKQNEIDPIHDIKILASAQSLDLSVQDDIVGLLEVADLFIRDEVARVYALLQSLDQPSSQPTSRPRTPKNKRAYNFNVATFLDKYTFSLPIVQSLVYKISGVVARAACAATSTQELVFDFDVKENVHEIQFTTNNVMRTLSILEIPPTNGRAISRMEDKQQVLTVLSSVEVVHLDASAVYALLNALNRPQVTNAIKEAQQQTQLIQHRLASFEETPAEQLDAAKVGGSAVVYDLHLTWAGLRISANTALKSALEPCAHILFGLDKVFLQATNRSEVDGPVTKYPALHVDLRHIGFDIRRGSEESMRSCGSFGLGVTVSARSLQTSTGKEDWEFNFKSHGLDVILSPDTVSTTVDVLGYMGDRIKDLDSSQELELLKRLKQSKPRITVNDQDSPTETDILDSVLASVVYHFELRDMRFSWDVAPPDDDNAPDVEDLVLTIDLIEFGTKTRKSARLTIESLQLQMVPPGQDRDLRALHSALLPEIMFNVAYVSTARTRRMAFQAVGQSLDLRLTSGFIKPAAHLANSISLSIKNAREASSQWTKDTSSANINTDAKVPSMSRPGSFSKTKRTESLLVDADFAGAVVRIVGVSPAAADFSRSTLAGKYGQFSVDESGDDAVLRSPGLAWKAEYRDDGEGYPSLSGEICIDASNNILYPPVVPLIMEIVASIKEVVKDGEDTEVEEAAPVEPKVKREKSVEGDNILTTDPSSVLGRMRLDLGLRICRQEFSLSCQPIARVAATTSFDSIYFTLTTVVSEEQGNFFAISGVFTNPKASVQHVYSRESTGSFAVDEITLSLMNSKHVSGTSGMSAILNVSPMKVAINAKQIQDFWLFREIWYPHELRRSQTAPIAKLTTETSQGHIQRYQQVAATAAFPWTATISIASLDVSIDLGQAIGKSVFQISKFWVLSKKTSDWEQNLCLGFDKVGVDCTGRLSGFVALENFRLRSSIQWPLREEALSETPLVQGSMSFNALRVKAAFDYQAFLVADVTSLAFIMYNVRETDGGSGDRLVATLDGESVQVFGITSSAAQMISLLEAFRKLLQERRETFETSLQELEKFMHRKSGVPRAPVAMPVREKPRDKNSAKSPISLDTDVIVTLKALNLGVFPTTFDENRVFKVEALGAYARFAASIEQARIHSILKMTLGQVRIGLASVRDAEGPRTLSEVSVEEVVERATGSRGGTILKVPRVTAAMQTWQTPNSKRIDYIFRSAFEGKVEVGWNYQRISIIRNMFAAHAKSLEAAWGKELPMAAVKITGVPESSEREAGESGEQQRITAEVNVPQSKYIYEALEPPIIETPQLRDMGEATPPLEWIGLNRDRLPNLTHQIVINSLLELAREVEDAYSRILGSS